MHVMGRDGMGWDEQTNKSAMRFDVLGERETVVIACWMDGVESCVWYVYSSLLFVEAVGRTVAAAPCTRL